MYEINTYKEKDEFIAKNERIGFASCNIPNQYDIWICELYKSKTTGKYSIFITADSDEAWLIIELE